MKSPTSSAPGIWKIDPAHSVVEFKLKHMMISNVLAIRTAEVDTASVGPHRPKLLQASSAAGIFVGRYCLEIAKDSWKIVSVEDIPCTRLFP